METKIIYRGRTFVYRFDIRETCVAFFCDLYYRGKSVDSRLFFMPRSTFYEVFSLSSPTAFKFFVQSLIKSLYYVSLSC